MIHRSPSHSASVARRALSIGSVLLAAMIAPSALAAQTAPVVPSTLSVEEAIRIARENNPTFLARQGDLAVARWRVRSASADFVPSVNASTALGYTQPGEQRFGSVGFGERPSYYSSSYGVGVSLEVSGSKLLQPMVARASERATQQRIEGEEATLVSNVVRQYLSIRQAQEAAAQAEREVARTGEYVRLAQARLEVGAGTQLDVRRAEVQQGQAEIRLVQAQNTMVTARLALGQLLGAPVPGDVQLTSEFQVFEPTWRTDDLVQRMLSNNPTLLAARATADAAGTSVRQAQSAYLPRLSFNTGINGSVYSAGNLDPLISQNLNERTYNSCVQQNRIFQAANLPTQQCLNPAVAADRDLVRQQLEAQNPSWPFGFTRQPVQASVQLSLPLYTGLQRQVSVAQAQSEARNAQYTVRAQELQLRTDVGTALRNLETAYRSAQILERVRATAAEELRLAQERFRFGAASSVEVTDAQTNLAEAERAQIETVYTFHQSLAALEALVGESLR